MIWSQLSKAAPSALQFGIAPLTTGIVKILVDKLTCIRCMDGSMALGECVYLPLLCTFPQLISALAVIFVSGDEVTLLAWFNWGRIYAHSYPNTSINYKLIYTPATLEVLRNSTDIASILRPPTVAQYEVRTANR